MTSFDNSGDRQTLDHRWYSVSAQEMLQQKGRQIEKVYGVVWRRDMTTSEERYRSQGERVKEIIVQNSEDRPAVTG